MTSTAWLFPGQGAQTPGMGRDLAERYPACRALFDRANEVLGYDLAGLCFEGPAEELTRSDRAQPAIFLVSAAVLAALETERPGRRPAAVAGLSSGEWAGLHAAEVLPFEEVVRILQARGRFMQEACELNPGGMLGVIGLERPALEEACRRSGAEIANLNSPEQTVLSGTREAIGEAERLAAEGGARKTVRLNVAGAFHSSLMQPAADRLARLLEGVTFRPPVLPAWSNVTAAPHADPDTIRANMVRQVTSPVRWVECVQGMRAAGIASYWECGPGRVLSGLVKRIDRDASLSNIQHLASLESALAGG